MQRRIIQRMGTASKQDANTGVSDAAQKGKIIVSYGGYMTRDELHIYMKRHMPDDGVLVGKNKIDAFGKVLKSAGLRIYEVIGESSYVITHDMIEIVCEGRPCDTVMAGAIYPEPAKYHALLRIFNDYPIDADAMDEDTLVQYHRMLDEWCESSKPSVIVARVDLPTKYQS